MNVSLAVADLIQRCVSPPVEFLGLAESRVKSVPYARVRNFLDVVVERAISQEPHIEFFIQWQYYKHELDQEPGKPHRLPRKRQLHRLPAKWQGPA